MKDRASVVSLFVAHANTTHISDIATVKDVPYTYTCRLNWTPQRACILVKSSEYWKKRMHLQKHDITLFVVWKHDSCLPYPLLCLEDGREYTPYACAVDTTHRTKKTSQAFLGQLLCGVQSAFDTLQEMPYQSRRRYERLLEQYAHRGKGRPRKLLGQNTQKKKGRPRKVS